ncbi:MAG: hypothetical protein K2N10_03910, partial [Muribaculaceae bacterium]|nr:hypothetical protein [Muribaculaceae bacterium]
PQVSNAQDYINGLKAFLSKKDVRLNIMLTNFDSAVVSETAVFKTIYESEAYRNNRVQIYNLNGKTFKSGNDIVHFCFADGQMYRIETDITQRKATGDFNNPEVVKNIYESYNAGIKLDTTVKVNLSDVFKQ